MWPKRLHVTITKIFAIRQLDTHHQRSLTRHAHPTADGTLAGLGFRLISLFPSGPFSHSADEFSVRDCTACTTLGSVWKNIRKKYITFPAYSETVATRAPGAVPF